MYKYVKSATDGRAELDRIADDAGYEIDISEDNEMTVSCIKNTEIMPTFNVYTDQEGDSYIFTPVMTFPEIDMRSSTYYDDAEYVMEQWMKAAKLCSAIMEYSI